MVLHRGKKHQCEKCGKKFNFLNTQKYHSENCDGIFEVNPRKIDYRIVNGQEGVEYTCNKCQQTFSDLLAFYAHYNQHRKGTEFKCDKCSKLFASKISMNTHLKKCDGTVRKKENKVKKGLDYREIVYDDSRKKFQCCICEKIFRIVSTTIQHIHTVHREKEYQCGKCNKLFTFSIDLKHHREKCDTLLKTKFNNINVKYQIVKTLEGNKHKCNLCHKTFSKRDTLYAHNSRKHKENNFMCENCGKHFASKSELNNHLQKCDALLRKENLKPFHERRFKIIQNSTERIKIQCKTCQEIFSERKNLRLHYRQAHNPNHKFKVNDSNYKIVESELGQIYECCQCDAKYKERRKFANHFYRVHKEKTLKCERCDKRFAHSTLLSIHLKRCKGKSLPKYNTKENISYKKILVGDRMENIQCMICEELFESISSFHGHYSNAHREKKFRCDKCSRIFISKSKFNRHVCQDQNEKPYVCNNCSKFKNTSNLWRHNITEHEKDSKGLMNNVLKCETCDKTFLEKGKLNKHLIVHDYEVVISHGICKENLNSKPEFNQHFYGLHLDKSVKTYKCYICERIYTDTWKLGEHLRGHETRKKLNYEIIHNSDSNTQYRCKKCQKTLISLYTFKKHFKDFHLPERNYTPSPKSKRSEDNSNLIQVIPVDTSKKGRKIASASFDISNIKLSGTDVLTIANIREDNDLIVNNTHLKLESENVYDEELETLYSVESNDIDPIGALDKEEKEFKMETEESILGI